MEKEVKKILKFTFLGIIIIISFLIYLVINDRNNKNNEDIVLLDNYVELFINEEYIINPILKQNVIITDIKSDNSNILIENNKVISVKEGNSKITITTNTNKQVFLNVLIKEPILENITLNKLKLELLVNEEENLFVITNPNYFKDEKVTWSSSDEKVVTVDNGKIKALKVGNATIKAKVLDKEVECKVTVLDKRKQVTYFRLDKIGLNLNVNEIYKLNIFTDQNINLDEINWSSINNDVVTINKGIITARNIGKATITGKIDNKTYSVVVNVGYNNYLKDLINSCTYSKQQILEFFKEVVLSSEYGTKEEVVEKWNGPIYYYYNDKATIEDINHINTIISELNKIPSLPSFVKTTKEKANFIIDFMSKEALYSEIRKPGIEGFSTYNSENNIITNSRIIISKDLDEQKRKSVITEEFIQALGIPNDSTKYTDSIFYQYKSDTLYPSKLDLIIISLLYNENIKYGMNYENVEKILNQIKQ